MISSDRMSSAPRLVDLSSRATAFAACAVFWWTWVSVALRTVIAMASSRNLDVSPAVLLAAAAVGTTILVGCGLGLTLVIFTLARSRAAAALEFAITHRRALARGVLRALVVAGFALGGPAAFAAVVSTYWFALTQSVGLIVSTADHIDEITFEPTVDAAAAFGAAFARMYLSLLIVVIGAAVPYITLRRFGPRTAAGSRSFE